MFKGPNRMTARIEEGYISRYTEIIAVYPSV